MQDRCNGPTRWSYFQQQPKENLTKMTRAGIMQALITHNNRHKPVSLKYFLSIKFLVSFYFQKALPVLSTYVRSISADSTSLRDVLANKIPEEIENVKAFRKSHGATKVGEVTVDMVSTQIAFVKPRIV